MVMIEIRWVDFPEATMIQVIIVNCVYGKKFSQLSEYKIHIKVEGKNI